MALFNFKDFKLPLSICYFLLHEFKVAGCISHVIADEMFITFTPTGMRTLTLAIG